MKEKEFYSFQQTANPSPYYVFLLPRGFYFLYLIACYLSGRFLEGLLGLLSFSIFSLLLFFVLRELYKESSLSLFGYLFGGFALFYQAKGIPLFVFSFFSVGYLFYLFKVSPFKKKELKKTLFYLLGKRKWEKLKKGSVLVPLFFLVFVPLTGKAEQKCIFWQSLSETPQVSFWDRQNRIISAGKGKLTSNFKELKDCKEVFVVFSGHNEGEDTSKKVEKTLELLKKSKAKVRCFIIDTCDGERIAKEVEMLFSPSCLVYSKGELPAFGYGALYYFITEPEKYEEVLKEFFSKVSPLLKKEKVKVDVVVKENGKRKELIWR